MNIFYLSSDPEQAAQWMVDKHVVKMILESAQLLSTAHRVIDGVETVETVNGRNKKIYTLDDERERILYKVTHVNHPCSKWVRESVDNYNWLSWHFDALLKEYTHRYGKYHKCDTMLYWLNCPPFKISENVGTVPALAMPDEYKIGDAEESYREYYRKGKSSLFKWTKREKPEWI